MSVQEAQTPSLRGQKIIWPSSATELGRKLEQNSYDAVKNPKGIIDLGSSVNELMLDDLSGWTKRDAKKSRLRDALGYGDAQGSPNLPQTAAEFLNEHFRVRHPLTNDNVLAATDTHTLLDTLIHNIADEGDTILVPTPSHVIFAHTVCAKNGVHVVEVPCDDIPEDWFWGHPAHDDTPVQPSALVKRLEAAIEVESSQKHKVRGVFLCNPANPLGRCYAAHVLLLVSQLCVKHEIYLIVDETYAMSAGDRFSSVLSLGLGMDSANIHVLWGMSDDLGLDNPGAAFLTTYSKQIYHAMRSLISMPGWTSSFSTTVAGKLLADAKYLRNHYLPSFRRRLNKRRKFVEEALEFHKVPYEKPEAGFFVFVDLSEWMKLNFQKHGKEGCTAFLEYMMDQRVYLEPGETFCSKRPGWFRLGFGGEKETFKLGLQRLLHCLRLLDGKEHTDRFAQAPKINFPPSKGMSHFSLA
ncbi:aminotransferase class I and II [Colletotrichum cereale]|nr:aminotransferase class I and II [Colletotrichum cereale]